MSPLYICDVVTGGQKVLAVACCTPDIWQHSKPAAEMVACCDKALVQMRVAACKLRQLAALTHLQT